MDNGLFIQRVSVISEIISGPFIVIIITGPEDIAVFVKNNLLINFRNAPSANRSGKALTILVVLPDELSSIAFQSVVQLLRVTFPFKVYFSKELFCSQELYLE